MNPCPNGHNWRPVSFYGGGQLDRCTRCDSARRNYPIGRIAVPPTVEELVTDLQVLRSELQEEAT